jgi:hypothetical protein
MDNCLPGTDTGDMDRERIAILGAVAISLASADAHAQTATQVVRFRVNAINQIGVSGSPAPMAITTASAGSSPTSVTTNGTSYAITTNEANQKITASLDQTLPAGVTLEVSLAPPAGATSMGSTPLTTTGTDIVTGISSTAAVALPITYRLSATPSVQMSTPAERTVTFTIVSGT